MAREISEQDLQQKIAELPKEIAPKRDLWAGIEKATQGKKQQAVTETKLFVPSAWAASLLAAVLVTWLSLSPKDTEPLQAQLGATQEKNFSDNQESAALVSFMETNFSQQKQAMLVSFGEPDLNNLPQEMQLQLQQLASARKSIAKALAADENNMDLLNLLDFTQQQELKLIQQLYRPQLQSI